MARASGRLRTFKALPIPHLTVISGNPVTLGGLMRDTGILAPAWKFLIHIAVGAFLFYAVGLVAIAVAAGVSFIERLQIAPRWMIGGGHFAERAIFWADLLLFGLFLVTETLKLAASFWRELRDTWRGQT